MWLRQHKRTVPLFRENGPFAFQEVKMKAASRTRSGLGAKQNRMRISRWLLSQIKNTPFWCPMQPPLFTCCFPFFIYAVRRPPLRQKTEPAPPKPASSKTGGRHPANRKRFSLFWSGEPDFFCSLGPAEGAAERWSGLFWVLPQYFFCRRYCVLNGNLVEWVLSGSLCGI